MADNTVRGRFVWHELMTPDASGAHAFYGKVIGWKTQTFEHDPSYQMFASGSGPVGGTVAQTSGAPHWLHYVGTPDIEATVQTAKSRGAAVTKEVTSIPGGAGRYAVFTDPQGAAIAVYQSSQDTGKETPPKRGEFSWHELATSDWKAAIDFYSAVFGWEKMAEHDMGPDMGKYVLFGSNGVQRGGMFNKPASMPGGPSWLGYVRVKNVNDAVKKAKSARGTLVNGPMEVPGGDWIAQFVDPYGAMFAVHTLAADLKPAATASTAAAPAEAAAPASEPAKPASAPKKAAAKKAATKKAPAKKAPAKKAAKKKAGKKKAAARSAKRPARKAAQKGGRKAAKKRSGGKKKAAKKARKGK
jgi:predicted enzyme related to lactoylglutathione lyase